MKKIKTLAVALGFTVATNSFASGIPVVDGAAIGQMVQQILEMKKQYDMLSDQYQQMQQQYQQLKEMTSKLEGISDVADLLRDEEKLNMFPEFYENITEYNKDVMEAGAKVIYTMRGFDLKCNGLKEDLKKACEQEAAYEASREYQFVEAMKKTQDRLFNLDQMIDEIKKSKTAKEIQDLQARIQAEMGMIQIANMKVELSKATFEAAIDGARKMKEAQTRRYFTVSDNKDFSKAFK